MSLIDDIVEVKRGNVHLRINRLDVDRYLAKGYDVVDANGNVIKSSIPNDINTLQKAYTEHTEMIKKLKAEIAELKKQNVQNTPIPKQSTTRKTKA